MQYVLPAIISGLVALAVAFGGFWFGRKKNDADAAGVVTNIALSLVQPLQERIDDLEAGYAELKRENAALHRWSQILFSQVIENGGTPTPFDALEET